jgi:phage-related protein
MIVLRHGHLSLVHSLATSEQNVIHEVSNEAGVIQSRRSDESSKETLEAGEWVAWVARRHAANATRVFYWQIHHASVLVMHYTSVQAFSRSCQIDNSYVAFRNFLRLRFL